MRSRHALTGAGIPFRGRATCCWSAPTDEEIVDAAARRDRDGRVRRPRWRRRRRPSRRAVVGRDADDVLPRRRAAAPRPARRRRARAAARRHRCRRARAPPFGVQPRLWQQTCELADQLADALVEDDEPDHDAAMAAAEALHDLLRPHYVLGRLTHAAGRARGLALAAGHADAPRRARSSRAAGRSGAGLRRAAARRGHRQAPARRRRRAVPDIHRLLDQIERGDRVAQPRLRHRYQVDRHGLAVSVHRLQGEGDNVHFDLHTNGSPLAQVLGADLRGRAAGRAGAAAIWSRCCTGRCAGAVPIGPSFIANLAGDASTVAGGDGRPAGVGARPARLPARHRAR